MEDKKTIRVVYVENDKCARVIELGTELEDMQKAVDGDIEGIFPFREEVCLVCNSMGKRLCKPNRVLRDSVSQPYLVICGSFFICDSSGTHFDSLTEAQIQRYLKMFEYPERIGMSNGKIVAVSVKPRENTKTNREER